jgi:glycosyltransferase involved in cell wall biosynthesis
MKFSIVVPVYNAEKTILNTLNSVAGQDYNDYEIIIINDGSTDDTDSAINEFMSANKNISCVYIITENKGVSHARNLGWNNATGDYICFLDSDDLWHSEKLKIISRVLIGYNCDFLGHLYRTDDFLNLPNIDKAKKVKLIKYLQKNLFQTSCVSLKRNIGMRFDEAMSFCEDYDLFLSIATIYKAYYINCELTKLGRPQLTQGGLSQNRIEMRKGEIRTYMKYCGKFKYLLPLLPALILWSFIKHIKSSICIFMHNLSRQGDRK